MKYILLLLHVVILSVSMAQEIQWADNVVAFSSEFVYDKYPGQYLAKEALGTPSLVTQSKSHPCAWTTNESEREAPEFIHVGFQTPQFIQQVLVHETYNAGAVSEVSIIGGNGEERVVYTNPAPTPVANGRMLQVKFDRTSFKVSEVKVTLLTNFVSGHNQIDAIGIADHQDDFTVKVNVRPEIEQLEILPENLGAGVNSSADDMSPVIAPDGKELYFTRQNHPENVVANKQDGWFSKREEGVFSKAANLGAPINNSSNNSPLSITPDGQRLLVLNRYESNGKITKGISISERNQNGWNMPVPVEIDSFVNNSKFGEYCLSNSGNILVMTIAMNDSEARKDLYVSFKKQDGSWTHPKSLGPLLNTASSEISPFLSSDDQTLYFATSGHPGYGKADIFVTRRLDDTWENWTVPENLGPYLNSAGFDAYYTLPASGESVYFVSSREGGFGETDIYRANLPNELRPKPVALVHGRVFNQKTKEVLETTIEYHSLSSGKMIGEARTDPQTGGYEIILPSGEKYGFFAKKEGFLPVSSEFALEELDKYQEKEVDLYMVPIEKDAKITINNVYFDTDKYDLRPESFTELNQLIQIMKVNPSMQVEIAGHTDDVGNDAHNQTLSENRADAVVTYMISKGINADRFQAVGYGESEPVTPNKDAASRQKNRRVEFIVRAI
ncbi:MAG: OmpA family protein [Fluviicola sp.]